MAERPEIFSDKCVTDLCPTVERLSERTCGRLGELGVGECSGMATMGLLRGRPIGNCGLGKVIVEAIKGGVTVPPSMIKTVAEGVAEGILDPYRIPTTLRADNEAIVDRWGSAVCHVETTRFPKAQLLNPVQTQVLPPPQEGQQQ